MKTIIEPFRIKSVEPILLQPLSSDALLRKAYFNQFLLHADDVLIDLFTDSGYQCHEQCSMAGIMLGDESYAAATVFFGLKTIQDLTGLPLVIPTHQGRAL